MESREGELKFIWEHANKITVIDGAIQIDPNDWQDVEFWYEDKPEHFRLVTFNEDYIRKIANEKGLNLIDAVEYVWKEKYEYEKGE